MKRCELCKSMARMFCDSDQASLCWDCDAKVHSANFLVAKHSRILLCHVCQSPTSWNGSGAKLGPTVSVCANCVDGCAGVKDTRSAEEESQGDNDDEIRTEEDYDDGGGDEDEEDEDSDGELSEDDEDGDNQVVPWSSTPPPPPFSASCSSSEETSSRFCNGHKVADLRSDDEHGCSTSRRSNSPPSAAAASRSTRDGEGSFFESTRPLKRLRTEPSRSAAVEREPAGSKTAFIVESLKRLHEQDLNTGDNASAAIVGICKLSKNPAATDWDMPI